MCSISHKELYLVPHWLPPPPLTIPLLYTAQLPTTHQLPEYPFSTVNYVSGRLCHCDENQEHHVDTCNLVDKVLSSQYPVSRSSHDRKHKNAWLQLEMDCVFDVACTINHSPAVLSLPDVSTRNLTYSAALDVMHCSHK